MEGAWCFGCCQAHRGLPVGFRLLWYSVLFTVESLSLLYLLFIYWFICSRKWCIDKLGAFHATKTYMCVSWATSDLRLRLAHRETALSPPVTYFLWPFKGGASFVDYLCLLCPVFFMLFCLFIAALRSPAGKGLTFWLVLACVGDLYYIFVTFPCGQVWYLIVSFPDLCHLSYFDPHLN